MWGCGGDSAVPSHSMGRVKGGERRDTHTHTQEHTHTCTYPLATYPLKSARLRFTFALGNLNVNPGLKSLRFFLSLGLFQSPILRCLESRDSNHRLRAIRNR